MNPTLNSPLNPASNQGASDQPDKPSAQNRALLLDEIKALIIQAVNLHHLSPSEIANETALTKGGLGLDSVDILEIVVAVEQKYKIKVKDAEAGKKYFGSIDGIADFVIANRV